MSASEAVEQLHALMEQVRILNAQVDAHTNLLRGNETMSLTMQELQVGVQNLQQAAQHIGGQIQPQEYEFIINPKDVKVNDFHGDPENVRDFVEDTVDMLNLTVANHKIAAALEWIELQEVLTEAKLTDHFGAYLNELNRKMYGFMKRKLKGTAKIWLKSQVPGEGAKAWRNMLHKYDPMSGETALDMHNKLMYRSRCAGYKDVPQAVELWETEQLKYTKGGKRGGPRPSPQYIA